MDDLISRQAAIDAVLDLDASHRVSWKDAVIDTIDALPTATERKRGEWIHAEDVGDCCYRCSACGYVYDAYSLTKNNYCQNCGADMRGAENEE